MAPPAGGKGGLIDSRENDGSANEKRLRVDGCKRAMMMSSGSIKGEKAGG